jgi:hypothetical protein
MERARCGDYCNVQVIDQMSLSSCAMNATAFGPGDVEARSRFLLFQARNVVDCTFVDVKFGVRICALARRAYVILRPW